MKQELLHHRWAYLILIAGLLGITLVFLGTWPNLFLQRVTIVAMMIFYTAWGMISHVHSDQFNKRILSEYLSISAVAGVILLLITL